MTISVSSSDFHYFNFITVFILRFLWMTDSEFKKVLKGKLLVDTISQNDLKLDLEIFRV